MSAIILTTALIYAQMALALAALLASVRVLRGPRAQDRILGMNVLYGIAMLLFIVTGIRTETPFFFEAALIIVLTGFVTNAALAKFLIRGEVIE